MKECWNQLQKVKEQEEDNPSWAAELRYWGVSGIPPPAASQVFLGLRNPLVLRTALGLRSGSIGIRVLDPDSSLDRLEVQGRVRLCSSLVSSEQFTLCKAEV